MGEWAFCPIEADGKPTPDKVGTAELKESETMQRIRKIDFPRLWKCINSNVNNNAWRDPEFHPVPVIYWDELQAELKNGWIVLPIQLHPPTKGGVCRFTVVVIDYDKQDDLSLAKYLQSKAYKASKPTIFDDLHQAVLYSIWQSGEQLDEHNRSIAKTIADRYAKAIGE